MVGVDRAPGTLRVAPLGLDTLAEIQMAPFTCLFVFLMWYCSGFLDQPGPPGFQKELNPFKGVPHQIVVKITRAGEIRIDGITTSPRHIYDDMAIAIQAHKRHGYPTRIALFCDREAPWSSTIRVLDAARYAGDDEVEFATR